MASQGKADPLQALNYDCINLVLQDLSPQDVAKAEQVSNSWKIHIRDWEAGPGCVHHFPDAWKELKVTNDLNAVEVFKECASQKTATDRWLAAKPRWVMECHPALIEKSERAAGDFISWTSLSDGHIYCQRVGYEKDTAGKWRQFPKVRVDLKVSRAAGTEIKCTRLHASGLLYVATSERGSPPDRVCTYRDHVFELETGKLLWSRGQATPPSRPLALGWERLYRHGPKPNSLEAYDLRTGDLLYTVSIPPEVYKSEQEARVWRLRGREVIVVPIRGHVVHRGFEYNLYLVDAETGLRVQVIKIVYHDYRPPRLKVSSRRGELAFAVMDQVVDEHTRAQTERIRFFEYDAAKGQFVDGKEEQMEIRGGAGAMSGQCGDYDPFRRFYTIPSFPEGHHSIFPFPGADADADGQDSPGTDHITANPVSFSVTGDVGGRDGVPVKPQRGLWGLAKVRIAGNRLWLFLDRGWVEEHGRKFIIVEFGPSALPLPSEDTLYRPDELD
ncbi:uncharacterized protein DSM5745_00079 [Aspergillus mulundensis]|uniref:F-box domain-containing protein n=1 Tax=Aspergillus mulundensis TaxID=1810919 RepID=A0A3D8T2G2_9EURO|nr:hypothetical protein DSM5745_00079 [Aspergillus mulundensis]RDW92757.1 hypothetical protein DSM5745_00079 [Aspergillus mulundensis]